MYSVSLHINKGINTLKNLLHSQYRSAGMSENLVSPSHVVKNRLFTKYSCREKCSNLPIVISVRYRSFKWQTSIFSCITTQPGKNGHLKIFIYAESILKINYFLNTLIVNEAFQVSIFARLSGMSTHLKNN